MKRRRRLVEAAVIGGVGIAMAAAMALATAMVFPLSPIPALAAGLGMLWICTHAGIAIGVSLGKRDERRRQPTT